MKVLFIGVYRDGTGWGDAARDWILALDAAGVDVVARPLKLNDISAEIPSRLLELEQKSSEGCNICIQCVLPHHMDYNGNFDRNIGMFFCETNHFRNTHWAESLNQMDECWVASASQRDAAVASNVYAPISIVPCATDVSKFEEDYEPLSIPDVKNHFTFYTIGELIRRKNLTALLKAFHLEFQTNESVELVIKGHLSGTSPADAMRHINEISRQIKAGLKLYPDEGDYKPEIVITKRLSDHEMMQLHRTCDCFVMPSYGEGWCIPAFDAMAMGKTPIVTSGTSMSEYVLGVEPNGAGGYFINSTEEPVFGMNEHTFPDLFVGNENWRSINVNLLRETMRFVFENKKDRYATAERGMDRAYDFSHEVVGNRMKHLLENTTPSCTLTSHMSMRDHYSMEFAHVQQD